MRATLMYSAGDVRVEEVPDAALQDPTDAVVRVVRTCICGSDLHPYHSKLMRSPPPWAMSSWARWRRSAPRSPA